MKEFENNNNMKFDYVMRFRTDTILFKKLNLDIFTLSENILNEKINLFKENKLEKNEVINSLIFPEFLNQNRKIIKTEIQDIYEYIIKKEFVLVIRANLIYITKRSNIDHIVNIIHKYAKKGHELEPSYYWNAENQFRNICLENKIDLLNFENESNQESFYNFNEETKIDEKTIYGIIRS
jgi:hypothetical protein